MVSALGQLTVIDSNLNQLKIYLKEFQADQPQKANQLNKELKKKMVNALLHACYSGQTEVLFMSPLLIHIQIWNLSAYNYENELEIMNSKPQ